MALQDRYGNSLSIQDTAALTHYQRGMDCWLASQPGAQSHYAAAIKLEPDFALAHAGLARAYFIRTQIDEAKQALAQASRCVADPKIRLTPREQSHIRIVDHLLNGAGLQAFEAILAHRVDYPRDALAIQPCCGVFGLIGFSGRAGREAENLAFMQSVARHYQGDWWFESQYAFAQCEVGQIDQAYDRNERALAANPNNANAVHHRAHLHYEMNECQAGIVALRQWRRSYARDALLYGHLAWHEALWALQQGDEAQVQTILTQELMPEVNAAPPLNVMTDLVSLLLRLELTGKGNTPEVWGLASRYANQNFSQPGLSFADAHSVIAHAMAGNENNHPRWQSTQEPVKGTAGDLVQKIALAFTAFAEQRWAEVLLALTPVMVQHERLGGSRAQRDLLESTYVFTLVKLGKQDEAVRWCEGRRPVLSQNVPG